MFARSIALFLTFVSPASAQLSLFQELASSGISPSVAATAQDNVSRANMTPNKIKKCLDAFSPMSGNVPLYTEDTYGGSAQQGYSPWDGEGLPEIGDFFSIETQAAGQPVPLVDYQDGVCSIMFTRRARWSPNQDLTEDNTEVCLDMVQGTKLLYSLPEKSSKDIPIIGNVFWFPDGAVREIFESINTEATIEHTCDVIETCEKQTRKLKAGKKSKKSKKSKSKKSNKGKSCVKKLGRKPLFEDNGLAYVDGDSIGYRARFTNLASDNTEYCPHVSFAKEKDSSGYRPCAKSEGLLESDLFSDVEILAIKEVGKDIGFGNKGYKAYVGKPCPAL